MPGPAHQLCEFEVEKLLLRLKMTLAADVGEISPAVDRIMESVRELECGSGHYFEIELSIREALANAIVHGCKQDRRQQVQVCVACDHARGMLIVVKDSGSGFDPDEIPSPVLGKNIYSSGGRGVYLINQLMDHVHYKNGGAEIHMIKR